MGVDEFLRLGIPCELCRYAEPRDSGGFVVVYCRKLDDIICDRQWINPLNCWKHCPCSPLSRHKCPYFEPKDEEEYMEQLEIAKKMLEQENAGEGV